MGRLAAFILSGLPPLSGPAANPDLPAVAFKLLLFQFEISFVPEKYEDCYFGKGLAYRGTYSLTASGTSCLSWNSVALAGKVYTAWKSNSQALGLGNHNYCRYAAKRPWGSCLGRRQDWGVGWEKISYLKL